MEMQEQLSNDAIAMAIVDPASEVVGLTIDDIIDDVDVDVDGEATRSADPVPSITASNVTSSGSGSSGSPSTSKKVDRELRQPFPVKVYEMLENADEKQFSHIVSWNEVGTGFMVHNKDLFTKEIVPHYFNLTKYKSFQRQLSLYGFQRVTVGPNKGLRYHEKLRKGELELVRQMKPVGYKPRNLTRLLEQQKQKEKQQKGNRTTLTTTTTTVVKTTTTSTTSTTLVTDPSNANDITQKTNTSSPTIIDDNHKIIEYPKSEHDSLAIDADHPDVSMATVNCITPVVSSNSLIKQDDQEASTEEKQLQLQQNDNHVHTISPETTYPYPIRLQSSSGVCDNSTAYGQVWNCNKQDEQGATQTQTQPEIVHFEGMGFHLMSPIRELGINVKLKLLEEFNPESSLLRFASKYATTGYSSSTAKPQTPPASVAPEAISPVTTSSDIDAVQEWPSGLSIETRRCNGTNPQFTFTSISAAAATASNIAALQSAAAIAFNNKSSAPTALLSFPTKSDDVSETGCMDALDFHAINSTTRILNENDTEISDEEHKTKTRVVQQ